MTTLIDAHADAFTCAWYGSSAVRQSLRDEAREAFLTAFPPTPAPICPARYRASLLKLLRVAPEVVFPLALQRHAEVSRHAANLMHPWVAVPEKP